MSQHVRNECVHGVLVSQCRCPGPIGGEKPVTIVACPQSCADRPAEDDATIDSFIGSLYIPPTILDRVRWGIKAAEADMDRRGLTLRDGYGAPYLIDGLIETAVRAALKS